ncbi:MAG TPA: hypothetical protein VD902_05855, partial [Symbiobacteriaceae bacterium]|nr:hypothetical protein [Symbiobacteriaceae bacterium]
ATWAGRGLALVPGPGALPALHFCAGVALMHTGDLLRARRELEHFLAAPLPPLAGDANYALGSLLLLLRQPAEAIPRLQDAAALLDGQGRRRQALACRLEAAWVLLTEEEPHEAMTCLEQTDLTEDDDELQTLAALCHALHHLLTGARKEADHICRELAAREGLHSRQLADLHWILARAALQEGAVPDALRHAHRASRAAAEHWWPPQMDRVHALRTRLLTTGSAV